MYMLRLVSALLHREVGEAVPKKAPDVCLPELCIVGALLACMIALSVWPAAISKHSFACLKQPALTSAGVSKQSTAQVGLACVPGTSNSTGTTGAAQ